jgi:hypothetical protein
MLSASKIIGINADGATMNVSTRNSAGDTVVFLRENIPARTQRRTESPNPEQALTPLASLLPDEQFGVAGVGGDSSYAQAWTTRFEDVTVRNSSTAFRSILAHAGVGF